MDTTLERFLAYHHAEAKNDGMVYSVWEDGEITLEKGGALFGQRNLHRMAGGDASKALPIAAMPLKSGTHGRILVKDEHDARAAHELITGKPPAFF